MSPSLFFLLTLAVTVIALVLQAISNRSHRRRLRKLAEEWKMHYSPDDRFRLADRVAELLPVPGAAGVRVTDLIFGNERNGYRYLFAASFTEGVIRAKRRGVHIATFHESPAHSSEASPLMVADTNLPIIEQYRQVHERMSKASQGNAAQITGFADAEPKN